MLSLSLLRTQYFLIDLFICIINSMTLQLSIQSSFFTHITVSKYKGIQHYDLDTKNTKSFLQIHFPTSYSIYHFCFGMFIF